MASKQAISTALATMHELFPTRDITANTARVWHEVMSDVPDDALLGAVRVACNQPGRTFFPTPGELRAILAPAPRAIDAESVCRQIAKLSTYTPHGYLHPRPETVREKMGNAAAVAYAQVGATRLFSENETTRQIAERDFAKLLEEEATTATPRMLPAPPDNRPLQLTPGETG